MVIRTNMMSLRTYREYRKTARATAKNLEKLSSGLRINRAADDASGLSASERMRAKITELDRCGNNALEGLNLTKTADGALAEINEMLRRARELCIQAANGTYSEQELASISDEMNQLFSEIDRITEGSRFNEIQLFRGNLGPDFHYEYDETFTPLEGGGQETWGDMDFIQTGDFDPPVEAKKATATFKLADGVDVNDPHTLSGKAIQIWGVTYYFAESGAAGPTTGISRRFSIRSTVEETLKQLVGFQDIENVAVSSDGTVTLTTSAKWEHYSFDTDKGHLEGDTIADGDYANGRPVSNPTNISPTIKQVDGSNADNNRAIYGDAEGTYTLSRLGDGTLTADQIESLQKNSLRIGTSSYNYKEINFKDLNIPSGATRKDVGDALAKKINDTLTNYTAVYDDATKGLTVTVTGLSKTYSTSMYIWENRAVKTPGTSGTPGYWDKPPVEAHWETGTFSCTSQGFGFSTSGKAGDNESQGTTTVTLPTVDTGKMTSCRIGSTTYIFYDSVRDKDSDSSYSLSFPGTSYDTHGKSDAEIKAYIAARLIANAPSGTRAERVGDTVVFTANNLNTPAPSISLGSATCTVTSHKWIPRQPGEGWHEGTSGTPTIYYDYALSPSTHYLSQPIEIPFHLGASLDKDKLSGSGFTIGSEKFEFVNGTGTGKDNDYKDIDISGCNDLADLLNAVKASLPSGGAWDAKLDWTDPNNVTLLVQSPYTTVTDGRLGVDELVAAPTQFAGGVDAFHSRKLLDFSSVNSSNLNDLLGKGFRVNCATCPNEYINIYFCWENGGRAPEEFEITGSDGVKRTIHNISVELSKVTSGDRIVEDIVNQVSGKLNHFTGLAVGTPPTTLIAYEKRPGRVEDAAGNLLLGSVDSGVKTNFTYTVNIRKVEDYPEDGSVAMKDNIVEIYVGSDPNPQIIPIHLPYLDLKTLRLSPPETVDLNDAAQDASDWLNRVDRANLAISKSRGVIGADHNRLEHAVKELSNAHVNLTDAESRIRDTDIAEEMMEHIKLQILTQAQQGMLAQANSQPQQILQLIS